MAANLLSALEIGTSTIRILIGESNSDGTLSIIKNFECESQGIRKGEIVNYQEAERSIQEALKKVEAESEIDIACLSLVFSCGEPQGFKHSGHISIQDPDDKLGAPVSVSDMQEAMEIAGNPPMPGQDIVHALPRLYSADSIVDKNPEGRFCHSLGAEALVIHAKNSSIQTFRKMLASIDVDVEGVYFSAVCAAKAVLSKEVKESGVLLIDLGAGTTDYIAYQDDLPFAAGSIAVGGVHVTQDISVGLGITRAQAEQVKLKDGSAIIDTMATGRNVAVPTIDRSRGEIVKKAALHTIINARVEETFEIVKRKIEESDPDLRFNGSVVLVGGGAYLPGVYELANKVFGSSARIGKIIENVGSDNVKQAAVIGCLMLSNEEHYNCKGSDFFNWFKKFGRKRS